MKYQIESRIDGVWSADNVTAAGGNNEFKTAAAAEEMIEILRDLGPDWADAEYRVAEVEAPTPPEEIMRRIEDYKKRILREAAEGTHKLVESAGSSHPTVHHLQEITGLVYAITALTTYMSGTWRNAANKGRAKNQQLVAEVASLAAQMREAWAKTRQQTDKAMALAEQVARLEAHIEAWGKGRTPPQPEDNKKTRIRVTLTNNFHESRLTLEFCEGDTILPERVRLIRKRLCGSKGCTCGDSLGRRGPQPESELILVQGRELNEYRVERVN